MKKIFTLLLLVSFASLMTAKTAKITCPTVTATLYSPTMCSGDISNIQLTSNVANTTYTWTIVQTGVTGASNGSGDYITQELRTTSYSYSGQVVYTITPFADNCSGTPITVTITVYPKPTVHASPTSQTISSGQYTNINLSSNVYGTTCIWNVAQSQGVTGASNGNGYSIIQTLSLINPSLAGHVDYVVTPIIGGCPGTPINVSVTVNPNLGTNDFGAQNFVISPNPVIDVLNIKNNKTIDKATVYNQLGQLVMQKQLNNNETQLDLSMLKSGIYFVTLISDKKQNTYKIVKN